MSHAAATAAAHDLGHDAWEADLSRVQRPALLIGAVGLVLTLIGLFINPDSGFKSYLWGYLFWASIPLGSLGFLMIQHLTGGTWGLVTRRFLEASSSLIVLTAIFAIPLLIVVMTKRYTIYPWIETADHAAQLGHIANENHAAFKRFWLTPWTWVLRTIIYFAVWGFLAMYLWGWSGREDRSGNTPKFAWNARVVAAPGIILFGLCLTFAYIDWVMTLDPSWYSTMWGVLYLVGSGLETMAFTIIVIRLLAERRPIRDLLSPGLLNDLGNLTFAFTLLWAYTNFSQLLIQWSGNIAEETPYYYVRSSKGWLALSIFLAIFHFFVPFLLLLWRKVKRDIRLLALVAVGILVVRGVELFWVVKPMFLQREITLPSAAHGASAHAAGATSGSHAGPGEQRPSNQTPATAPAHGATAEAQPSHNTPVEHHGEAAVAGTGHAAHADYDLPDVKGVWQGGVNWTDIPAIAGIGGIWVAAFAWRLKQRPLLPPNDPRLAELARGHH